MSDIEQSRPRGAKLKLTRDSNQADVRYSMRWWAEPPAARVGLGALLWAPLSSARAERIAQNHAGSTRPHRRALRPSLCVLYATEVVQHGVELFRLACERNLEGIVAKHRDSMYGDGARWLKIKNPEYTQAVGRRKRFERRRA